MAMLKRIIPWITVGAAFLMMLTILFGIPQRKRMLEDSGDTRTEVETLVAGITGTVYGSADSRELIAAAKVLGETDYIAYVWLFDDTGKIVYTTSLAARSADTAEQLATSETERLLLIIPDDSISDMQRIMFLAASAVQAEGEHNDIYRHMLREIRGADDILGWIAVAYHVNSSVGKTDASWITAVLIWLLSFGIYWISLPIYVWLDARDRGDRALAWAIFTLIGNFVSLLAYLIVRPEKPKEFPVENDK